MPVSSMVTAHSPEPLNMDAQARTALKPVLAKGWMEKVKSISFPFPHHHLQPCPVQPPDWIWRSTTAILWVVRVVSPALPPPA